MRMVPGLQVLSYTAEGGIKVEGLVVWTFSDTANLVYAANPFGSWMAGVQGYETAGGSKGCFGGRRAGVAVAQVSEVATGRDHVIGR